MNKKYTDNYISSELLAAYLDGEATAVENEKVLGAIVGSPELQEVVRISQTLDEELIHANEIDFFPMTAMAASCGEESYCSLECEKYILSKHHVVYDEKKLLADALCNKWTNQEGTALFNVGRHLENFGFTVSRRYQCSITDIVSALNKNIDVIIAVDGGELLGNPEKELIEDLFVGQIPDHAVVVLACNIENNVIEIYNPDSPNEKDCYSIKQFTNAWADSKFYMVTARLTDAAHYVPHPIDLSDVELTEDLIELREAIAENAHEIWAENRQAEGWTYGPQRDDQKKLHPDMIPYSQLPESEKEYDRGMAMKTIKLLKKLGYDIVKRRSFKSSQTFTQQKNNFNRTYHCRACGNAIHKHQNYCDKCGNKLEY